MGLLASKMTMERSARHRRENCLKHREMSSHDVQVIATQVTREQMSSSRVLMAFRAVDAGPRQKMLASKSTHMLSLWLVRGPMFV